MSYPKTLLFFILFLPLSQTLYAQKSNIGYYDPNKLNYSYKKIKEYEIYLNAVKKKNIDVLDKNIQKEYEAIIKEKNDTVIAQLNKKGFLFDSLAYPYLNSIFLDIIDKNGLDRNQFHFFVDRTSEINAYSYEDGTIVCNLGLVNTIENESQLAFVFCHELGHYLLKHVNKAVEKQLERYHSPEVLAKIHAVKKQNYSAKKQLEDFLISDVFDRVKHSRFQENAADSLGILLFRKTGYSCTSVPHVFDLLDSSDNRKSICSVSYFFKNQGISIDEDWITPPKKISFRKVIKKEDVDSLKTHPDCLRRKIIIQAFFDKNPCTGKDYLIADKQKLTDVKRLAFFDEANYAKDKCNLGFYLYQLIQNDARFSSSSYIKTEIFNTFVILYDHCKTHTLHIVLNKLYIPENGNDEYAKLLTLIDSISLNTLGDMAAKYYQNNNSQINASAATINKFSNLIH